MYETEVNRLIVSWQEIPQMIGQQFGGLSELVLARTVLPWSEHCTECVWPTCYKTCDLYVPRKDGRCRRFDDGMVRVACPWALNSYLLRIQFKQWAKLWSPANVRLYPTKHAEKIERNDYQIGKVLQQLPVPGKLRTIAAEKRYGFKKREATRPSAGGELPTSFLLECYNPTADEVRLTLTMRPIGVRGKFPFLRLFNLAPGFSRIRVRIDDIMKLIDLHSPFDIELVPNDVEKLTTLYFGVMDFVRELSAKPSRGANVKCVVWDLDNTLWNGILVEDGIDELSLKQGICDIIRTFDERGILQSLISKNDHGQAMEALKRFQIDDYFLYPQISWEPKSEGIEAIARHLNIGTDSILFIDDSKFERDQVKAVYPLVRAVDALDYTEILKMDECQGTITAEGKGRRKLYQTEAERADASEAFGSDYLAFLRDAKIVVAIGPMNEENFERVHELTQRTNQMNFSGNRYDRDVLKRIAANPFLETYVLSCEDRFGSYGIVGFCIVDPREPRVTDLMFSCRVQSKRIEHAFLSYVLRKHISGPADSLFVSCRKTPRNEASIKVFADFDMEEIETVDGVTMMSFRGNKEIPDDGVVTIVETPVEAVGL